jgi:hypothetical protein
MQKTSMSRIERIQAFQRLTKDLSVFSDDLKSIWIDCRGCSNEMRLQIPIIFNMYGLMMYSQQTPLDHYSVSFTIGNDYVVGSNQIKRNTTSTCAIQLKDFISRLQMKPTTSIKEPEEMNKNKSPFNYAIVTNATETEESIIVGSGMVLADDPAVARRLIDQKHNDLDITKHTVHLSSYTS